jgi:hypothetical protein
MQYSVPANGTLYVKVHLRKSPYANKVIALRLTANFYEDFKHNEVLLLRETSPQTTKAQLYAVIASMQKDAHAANICVNMPPTVSKLLKD